MRCPELCPELGRGAIEGLDIVYRNIINAASRLGSHPFGSAQDKDFMTEAASGPRQEEEMSEKIGFASSTEWVILLNAETRRGGRHGK